MGLAIPYFERANSCLSLSPREALAVLKGELPPSLSRQIIAVRKALYEGYAYRYLQQFPQAKQKLADAEKLAQTIQPQLLCQVFIAKAGLEFDREDFGPAEADYTRAVALAKQYGLPEQQANAENRPRLSSPRKENGSTKRLTATRTHSLQHAPSKWPHSKPPSLAI